MTTPRTYIGTPHNTNPTKFINTKRTMTLPTSGTIQGFGGANGGPSDPLLLGLTILAITSLFYATFIFRPRTKGGSTAPPVVTSSPVSKLPVVGTIVEFGKSPVRMVQRCYEDYGPVFTVPVRELLLCFKYVLCVCHWWVI